MINLPVSKEESIRLHTDWYGKCRTCEFWGGTDSPGHLRWNPGLCNNEKSDLYKVETWTEGHCEHWSSFDPATCGEMFLSDQS